MLDRVVAPRARRGARQGRHHERRTPAEREARRTALILAASQAIVGSAAPICISHRRRWPATICSTPTSRWRPRRSPASMSAWRSAPLPAASLIRSARPAQRLQLGTAITALGGLVATLALFQASFWLFVARPAGDRPRRRLRAAVPLRRRRQRAARIQGARHLLRAGGRRRSPPSSARRSSSSRANCSRRSCSPAPSPSSSALAAVGAVILSFLRVPAIAQIRHTATVRCSGARRSCEIVAQPQFAVGAALRGRLLRADELRHDRRAAGHGRLRLLAGRGDARHLVARHGDVRAELLHRRV